MEQKQFQRKVENFACTHCGAEITGNGYTNHCSHCLWSKHVDVNPGDRAATCGGMMRPTNVENEKGEYIITHTCELCGHTKRNKVSAEDDFDTVVQLAVELAGMESTSVAARAPLGAGQQMSGSFAPGLGRPQTAS